MKTTVDELVEQLKSISDQQEDPDSDWEYDHERADTLLLEFINNDKVTEAFDSIRKWYA